MDERERRRASDRRSGAGAAIAALSAVVPLALGFAGAATGRSDVVVAAVGLLAGWSLSGSV